MQPAQQTRTSTQITTMTAMSQPDIEHTSYPLFA